MSDTPLSIRPFGWRDRIGYMLGNVANDFTFIFASLYLQVFYTDVLGINAAIVGTMFLIARRFGKKELGICLAAIYPLSKKKVNENTAILRLKRGE